MHVFNYDEREQFPLFPSYNHLKYSIKENLPFIAPNFHSLALNKTYLGLI